MLHPLDHLVLPVTNIDLARERLGRLGFTVAAEGRHPFGTVNACVFFADKTYLEPLGVASAKECEESVRHWKRLCGARPGLSVPVRQ